jgi:putative endonuclease
VVELVETTCYQNAKRWLSLSKPLVTKNKKQLWSKMVGYMYILQCRDGSYYVGSTKDLERRIWEHNAGIGAVYTAKRTPVVLKYYEEYLRIDDAFRREKQVQGWSKKKREALINGEHHLLPELAKSVNRMK